MCVVLSHCACGNLLHGSRKLIQEGKVQGLEGSRHFCEEKRKERRKDGNERGREERKESTGEYAVLYDFRPRLPCMCEF